MTKVLILSASYGEGHNAAARGLRLGIEQIGQAEAELYDPFPESYGSWYERSRKDYLQMIERRPRLWGLVYNLLHRTPLIFFVLPVLGRLRRALKKKITDWGPNVVVTTYPLYLYLINQIFRDPKRRPFRVFTIVTDSITINSVWHRTPSDTWLLPNDASAEVMRVAGVPSERIRVLGFPVAPIFAGKRPERTPPSKDEPLRVLYMVNADRQSAPALVARLLRMEGLSLTVTAGRDEAVKAAIEGVVRQSGKKAVLLGWTTQMPELLMEHHVLVGKAGGAAVQESIAARTPMIVTKVVPGQEEGNARLLVENECGAICETPDAILDLLGRLKSDDGKLWKAWEANIARLSRPDAALRIAEEIVK